MVSVFKRVLGCEYRRVTGGCPTLSCQNSTIKLVLIQLKGIGSVLACVRVCLRARVCVSARPRQKGHRGNYRCLCEGSVTSSKGRFLTLLATAGPKRESGGMLFAH